MRDSDSFMNAWWEVSAPLSHEVEDWIDKTYSDPLKFWETCFFEQQNVLPPSKSTLGASYDFYHDCVARHLDSGKMGFLQIQGVGEQESWTYRRLHHCVNFHIDKWSFQSPEPDQLIAIVGEPTIHYVIALLTALRFGLRIFYLPTNSPLLGKGLIQALLSKIKPCFLVSQDASFHTGGVPLLPINIEGLDEENHAPSSYAYPAESSLQIALSLDRQEPFSIVSLDAESVYLSSLRDALYTLNLIKYPYWASPLACPIRAEPCSTIVSLICGATRTLIPDELLRSKPALLQDERINLLGISGPLQRLWSKGHEVPARSLKSCYKNPLEISFQNWLAFVQRNKMDKISFFDLLIDNACCGATLFSKPTQETFNVYLKPTLGTEWWITDISGSGEETPSGFGILRIDPSSIEQEIAINNLCVNQVQKNLMITGFIQPCREGVTVPFLQIEEEIGKLPFVEGCMLHSIQSSGGMFQKHFILLVFVNPEQKPISTQDRDAWSAQIRDTIETHQGKGFLPDEIEYINLIPRRHVLGIDRKWCANQYNSGLLKRKMSHSEFQAIGILKKLAQKAFINTGFG